MSCSDEMCGSRMSKHSTCHYRFMIIHELCNKEIKKKQIQKEEAGPSRRKRQQCKCPAQHRPSRKVRAGVASSLAIKQISIGRRLRRVVDPLDLQVNQQRPRALLGNGGREHLPVALDPVVPSVQGHAVLERDGWVEVALDGVDVVIDKVEAQESVCVEVVEHAVGGWVVVVQHGVWWGAGVVEAKADPLWQVVFCYTRVVGLSGCIADQVAHLAHGFQCDDTLDGEVGLVGERSGKVVGGDLVHRDEGLVDEVAGPLLQFGEVLGQVGSVTGTLGVGEGHDEHVAALLEGHGLVVAGGVAQSVRPDAQVVLGVAVGVEAALLVDVERVQEKFDPSLVEVEEDGHGWEDDIGGVGVTVRANLLHEDIGLLGANGGSGSRENLAHGESAQGSQVSSTCSGSV